MNAQSLASLRGAAPGCPSDMMLDRLVAGELEPAAKAELDRHVAGCASCTTRLKNRTAGFGAWGDIDAGALWNHVQRALDQVGVSAPFFEGIDGKAREDLMQFCRILQLDTGDDLTLEGTAQSEMYVVLDGVFDVTVGGRLIDRRQAGDLVGEIAFLTDGKRSATVKAGTPARVLVIRETFLERFTQAHPTAGFHLLMNLARVVAGRFTEKVRTLAAQAP